MRLGWLLEPVAAPVAPLPGTMSPAARWPLTCVASGTSRYTFAQEARIVRGERLPPRAERSVSLQKHAAARERLAGHGGERPEPGGVVEDAAAAHLPGQRHTVIGRVVSSGYSHCGPSVKASASAAATGSLR